MLHSAPMPLVASWMLCVIIAIGVGMLTLKEYLVYRKDQRTRADIYPYTRARFYRRAAISSLLVTESLLLLVVRHTLRPDQPTWLITYVCLVVGAALGMVVLAFLDFRESAKLLDQSSKQLLGEFIHELKQGKKPPVQH